MERFLYPFVMFVGFHLVFLAVALPMFALAP
jgi:uncharacterized membrane protein